MIYSDIFARYFKTVKVCYIDGRRICRTEKLVALFSFDL